MKMTKEDFVKVVAEVIKEQTADALEQGSSDIAMALLLTGAKFGTAITDKLFATDENIELVTEKE